jgi:UDP:flavonoid glycosyltransferase YjiC (YdhE family)
MRILFATVAADGHFNPLTGIAMHLREAGHDVRWYTGQSYAAKLERLGIPHFPFQRAIEINGDSLATLFPERARLRGPALIRFDFEQIFVNNVEKYFEDVCEIDQTFPFDVLFCDAGFMAARLVRDSLRKHVCAVGVSTMLATSRDVPPNFLGLKPARTAAGRFVHRAMGAAMDRMVLARGTATYNRMLATRGIAPVKGSIYDEFYGAADVIFQSGVPGFEYPRREVNTKLRFVGPLLPHGAATDRPFPYPEKLKADQRVILVSQGTLDNKDPGKLIIPAVEALKDSGDLVIVATGHSHTEELRQSYRQDNVVVEDYVDFAAVLQGTDLFICNGGYGSVLLSLGRGVPLLVAGVREGKNDVNARVDHFGVGINLHTERPKPDAIYRAAKRLLTEPRWKQNAMRLRDELRRYRPYELIDDYLANELAPGGPGSKQAMGDVKGHESLAS